MLQLTDEPDKRCYPLGDHLLCHTCHIARLSSQYPDQTFYMDPKTRNIQNTSRDPRHSLSLPATSPSSYTAVSMQNFGGPPLMMSGSGGGNNSTVGGGWIPSGPHTYAGSHYDNGRAGMQNGGGMHLPSHAPLQHMSSIGGSSTSSNSSSNGYSPGPAPPRPTSSKPTTYTITDL